MNRLTASSTRVKIVFISHLFYPSIFYLRLK
nr:MAG TPA: hypothetical protein [Caudoviricetes sp.]